MGIGRSVLRRTIRAPAETQSRMEKVLESEPIVAPKHETTKELIKQSKTKNQAIFDVYNQRNEEFLNRLKGIHVDAVDVNEEHDPSESSPTTKKTVSLKSEQLVFLFQQRMLSPEEWNEEKIATFFQLPEETVTNLLKHYGDFNVEKAPKLPEPLEDITI